MVSLCEVNGGQSVKFRARSLIYRKPVREPVYLRISHFWKEVNLLFVQQFTCEWNIWNIQNIFVPFMWSKFEVKYFNAFTFSALFCVKTFLCCYRHCGQRSEMFTIVVLCQFSYTSSLVRYQWVWGVSAKFCTTGTLFRKKAY